MSAETATEAIPRIPRINDTAPNFTAETTQGSIDFHDGSAMAGRFVLPPQRFHSGMHYRTWLYGAAAAGIRQAQHENYWPKRRSREQSWQMGGRYRGDAGRQSQLSDDWRPAAQDCQALRHVASGERKHSEGRTAADNATVRTVFVVGPDKKIKLQLSYPMATGRNFDEILRVIDSMQLTAKYKWLRRKLEAGDEVIILPSVSNEEAQQKYPGGWKSPKPYLRIVPQPK